MSKPRKELNPRLKVGDRIMCLQMDGETSVPMGTHGTVVKVGRDPFEVDSEIITVNWDNGSILGLLSGVDRWIMAEQENITEETGDVHYDFFSKNPEVFENFDWKYLKEFLEKVRKASPVNMHQAAPFLYSGSEWIERYYGEGNEDNEDFQEMLEMADETKDKMVQGVVKFMESKGVEIEVEKANRYMRKLANVILELYMFFV